MLDQNTDRMWYVIGAVLIGAAIILIANGTIPQMFASITDSFEQVSKNAVQGVHQVQAGENMLDESENGVGEQFTTVEWSGWDYRLYEIPFDEYGLQPGDTVTFSFYVEETNQEVAAFLQVRDVTNAKFSQSTNRETVLPGESGYTSVTWTIPAKTNNAPAEPVVLYASIRDNNNGGNATSWSNVSFNQATIWKH